jgi:hypothetical protein
LPGILLSAIIRAGSEDACGHAHTRAERRRTVKRKALAAAVLLPLLLLACDNHREKAIAKIKDDEEAIKHASAVVNEVIRNSTDCNVAKPLIAEARKRIETAQELVTAPATRATLGALTAQVDRVAQVCP